MLSLIESCVHNAVKVNRKCKLYYVPAFFALTLELPLINRKINEQTTLAQIDFQCMDHNIFLICVSNVFHCIVELCLSI